MRHPRSSRTTLTVRRLPLTVVVLDEVERPLLDEDDADTPEELLALPRVDALEAEEAAWSVSATTMLRRLPSAAIIVLMHRPDGTALAATRMMVNTITKESGGRSRHPPSYFFGLVELAVESP